MISSMRASTTVYDKWVSYLFHAVAVFVSLMPRTAGCDYLKAPDSIPTIID